MGVPEPPPKEAPPPQVELPGWLMDQPTASGISSVRVPTPQPEAIPATPRIGASSNQWEVPQASFSMTEDLAPASDQTQAMRLPSSTSHSSSSPTWQPMVPPHTASYPAMPPQPSGPLQPAGNGRPGPEVTNLTEKSPDALQDSNPMLATGTLRAQRLAARRNYAALVSALQTLGYSITGFIAAAVINIEGQPVAQVAIDDLDISKLCRYFSVIQKSILQALAQEAEAGDYEETVITSFGRHILMRAVGTDRKAFLVLITTREANPPESLEVMANVEGAISAALR
jgi:predicted regulator of Ras-like GTPase activity (Roadblock/LC7/MglB family)